LKAEQIVSVYSSDGHFVQQGDMEKTICQRLATSIYGIITKIDEDLKAVSRK
jgi:hypothetical protein